MASQNENKAPFLLPTDRYESYMYSKHDINEVLDWLCNNVFAKLKHNQFGLRLTLRDILFAATSVVARKVEIPSRIQNAFKRILRVRSKLTAWFRKVETSRGKDPSASTDAHEAFNRTLLQVYNIMFPGNEKMDSDNSQKDEQLDTSVGDYRDSDNAYDILAKIGEDQNKASEDSFKGHTPSPKKKLLDNTEDDDVSDYIIEGDPLRDQCEAMSWLQELDTGCSLVKRWFEKARDNEMPTVLAAALTNNLINYFLARDVSENHGKRIGNCDQVLTLLHERQQQDAESGSCCTSTGKVYEDEDQNDHEAAICNTFQEGFPLMMFSHALLDFISLKDNFPDFLSSVECQPIHS